MISREVLKNEIDSVQEQYLAILYTIIKSFEAGTLPLPLPQPVSPKNREYGKKDWSQFIHKFAGCLSGDPIKRGNQGEFEIRERLE